MKSSCVVVERKLPEGDVKLELRKIDIDLSKEGFVSISRTDQALIVLVNGDAYAIGTMENITDLKGVESWTEKHEHLG